jgi:Protein of unknown function (DUF669)
MAQLNFNARNVAPELPRDPIPAGVYLVHITESDVVATKNGGQMLKLTHEVLEGPHKGRKVFSNINIQNSSAEAERIGQSQLSALCHAVNVLDLHESSMLHMIPLRMRVSIRPAGPDKNGVPRDAQNEVKGYESARGAQPAPAAVGYQAAPAPQQPAAAAQQPAFQVPPARPAGGAAPWARRAA